MKNLLFNIFLYLLHPNLIVEHFNIINENNEISFGYVDGKVIIYTLNDLMLILNLLNIIPFFSSCIKYIKFNSNVADRLWYFNK